MYTHTQQSRSPVLLLRLSPTLICGSSSAEMLRLFGLSQVEAVSVLGTLTKDKAAVTLDGGRGHQPDKEGRDDSTEEGI